VEYVELRVPFYNSKNKSYIIPKTEIKMYLPVVSESLDLNPKLILILHHVRRQ